MESNQRTAILVIHGIGEQEPFESIDCVSRTLVKVLEKERNGNIILNHKFENRKAWIDNYISFESDGYSTIDVYEYYWAHLPQRKVNFSEILDWLLSTSNGASKFYEENNRLIATYENNVQEEVFRGNTTIKKRWYLKHLSWFVKVLALLRIPKITFFDGIIKYMLGKGEKIFVDFVGDVAVYTSVSERDKTFEIRKNILNGAFEELKLIIECSRYDKIIVAGHSLGSVIAYDAINKLNNEMNFNEELKNNAWRLQGFVTFGSPLDKIAFFFRDHTKEEQFVRRQILAHYHNFKNKDLNLKNDPVKICSPYKPYLAHVKWINFWNIADPVSGQLDFYEIDENITLPLRRRWGECHVEYWESEEMYRRIIQEYLF